MTEYRYTDVDGDRIAVFGADIPGKGKGVNVRTDPNGCSVPAADAPELARAILAAGGVTGHVVISEDDLEMECRLHASQAAEDTRKRIVRQIHDAAQSRERDLSIAPKSKYLAGDFEALQRARDIAATVPLLPGAPDTGDDTYEVTHGLDHTHVRTYAAPGEDFDAGWAAGHAHARADSDRIADLEERVDLLAGRLRTHSEHLSQAQAAIRGLESGRVAPRRAVKYTPAEDH